MLSDQISTGYFGPCPQYNQLSKYQMVLQNLYWVEEIFKKTGQEMQTADTHILLKFLFAMIGEI